MLNRLTGKHLRILEHGRRAGALLNNTTASGNTALGYMALYSNTNGHYNIGIGIGANVSSGDFVNAIAIGSDALVNSSHKIVLGNNFITSIGGYAGWANFSDIRVKKDIRNITCGLELIKALRPVEFTMKNGNGNTDFGFIAQEVEALLGDKSNVLDVGGGEERMLSLRYTQLIAPMVKAMQEQQGVIEEQRAQLKTLEERLARVEALLNVK